MIDWGRVLNDSRVASLFRGLLSSGATNITVTLGSPGEAGCTGFPGVAREEAGILLEQLVKEGVFERDGGSAGRPTFRLTAEASRGLRSYVASLLAMKTGVEALGLKADLFGTLRGASGVVHTFDLLIQTKGGVVPVDVRFAAEGRAVETMAVLSTYAKVLDTKSERCVLVAIPGATDDARKCAESYFLQVFEGRDVDAVLRQFATHLSSLNA